MNLDCRRRRFNAGAACKKLSRQRVHHYEHDERADDAECLRGGYCGRNQYGSTPPQLASGRPSALVDWNNNYGDDSDKCVFFHCGNWAKDFLPDIRIGTAPILGTVLGEANTVQVPWRDGLLPGRLPFGRVSTDDRTGAIPKSLRGGGPSLRMIRWIRLERRRWCRFRSYRS